MTDSNGTVSGMSKTPLDPIERGVLEACHEAAVRRQEMLPVLAEVVGVDPGDVFYTWTVRREWLLRRCGQHGPLGRAGWSFFFHGFECDLKHEDGRLLRFDFGPGGRVDTFTMWGVLQFIMTSVPPWPEYPDLTSRFAKNENRSTRGAGDVGAMEAVWDRLAARGAFEPAAPALVEFMERHTAREADGLLYVRYPPGTPETTTIDCSVSHRLILSPVGRHLLEMHTASHSA
jgi:hypothetical protein